MEKSLPLHTVFLTSEFRKLPTHISMCRCPCEHMSQLPCSAFGARNSSTLNNTVFPVPFVDDVARVMMEIPISRLPRCMKCDGNSPSASKKWPIFMDKKEIQELKVKRDLTFPKAQKWFLETKPKMSETPCSSFLSVTKWSWCSSTSNSSVYTQSDPFLWSSVTSIQIWSYHLQSTGWTQKHVLASHISTCHQAKKKCISVLTQVIEYDKDFWRNRDPV